MAVIELGLVSGHDAEPARRPLGRRDLRRLLVAVVTVGCVLTVTGSSRPGPGGLRQLWSTGFEQSTGTFTLTGDSVYVLTQPGADRITAYDLRTGAVRWSHPTPADATWLSDVRAGALLLPVGLSTAVYKDADGSPVSREFNRETAAVDAASGRQLWRQTGELVATVGDRALLSEWNEAGDKVTTFRTVGLRDGGTVWSRPAGDIASWVTDSAPGTTAERLVTVTAKGRAEVLDLADGAVLATGNLPMAANSTPANGNTSVMLRSRQLYLDRTEGEGSAVSAYDTDTLRRLWHREQAGPGGIYDCGPVVCLNGTNRTTGHDPRTGAERWRVAGAANGFPLLNGLLMVDDESGVRHHLIDATTGRQIADLGTASPVWDYRFNGTPYVVSRAQDPAGLMLLSRVDERSGEVLLRGVIPPVLDYGCQSNGSLVVCVTPDNRLIVTDAG